MGKKKKRAEKGENSVGGDENVIETVDDAFRRTKSALVENHSRAKVPPPSRCLQRVGWNERFFSFFIYSVCHVQRLPSTRGRCLPNRPLLSPRTLFLLLDIHVCSLYTWVTLVRVCSFYQVLVRKISECVISISLSRNLSSRLSQFGTISSRLHDSVARNAWRGHAD